jgi:AAA domain-containing protein
MSRDQSRDEGPSVPFSRYPNLRFGRKGSTWQVTHRSEDWPLTLYARDVYYGTGRMLSTITLDRQDPGTPHPTRILTSSVDLLIARQRTNFAEEAARRLARASGPDEAALKAQVTGVTTLLDALLERLSEVRYELDMVSLEDVPIPDDLTPRYAVWPLVPRMRPGLLIAPSGSGKSTLAAGVAVGVVTGTDIVPAISARDHGPVIYIGQEEDAEQMRIRVQMLMKGHQVDASLRDFYYMKLRGGSLLDSAESVAEQCARVGAKLVIVDSAQATWGAGEDNVREYASRWYTSLELFETPTLIIDHPSLAGMKQKSGQELMAAGTSVKRDRSGHVWTVRSIEVPVRDGQPYKYHVTLTDAKRNYVGRQPNIDYETMVMGHDWAKFVEAGVFDAEAVVESSRTFESIASIMREPDDTHEEGWEVKELTARLKMKDDRRIRAELNLGQWRTAPWSNEEEVTILQTEGTGTSPTNPAKYQLSKRRVAIQMSMAPGDEDVIN